MPNLTDLVGSGNLKTVQLALSTTAGTNSPTFAGSTWTKIPLNVKFSDPYNICTLNTSLSSFTLPQGVYQIVVSVQATNDTAGSGATDYVTRLRNNTSNTTLTKWPANTSNAADNYDRPGATTFTPACFDLSTTSSISLENYWAATRAWGSTINDGESNIYYVVNIYKLR